ncbi:MAG: peptide deformylase [Candidatus Aminicenantales bacterium]|jgi:peptide deformylase
MAVLEILTIGHPILTKKAERVDRIDPELVRLAKDMVETMRRAPGVGLAAPQVNVSKRLITIDLSVGENEDELIILVNPEIVRAEGEVVCEEGCLSVPDIREKVARPYRVLVKGLDLGGNEVEVEGEDLLARALCHEIDHLDGKLFTDRLSPLKKTLLRKKLKKTADTGLKL